VFGERSSDSGRACTIESTSVLLRSVVGNGNGSQGGSSSRNDAGGWAFDLFETRRASPKQRTRERVTTGCSRLVEWGLWRSQWESNLDSVNLGQSQSSATKYVHCSQLRNNPETARSNVSWDTPETRARYRRTRMEVPTHRGCVAEVGRRRCARPFSGSGRGMQVVLAQKRETAPGDVTSDVGSRWQNREIGVDRKRSPQKGDPLSGDGSPRNLRNEVLGSISIPALLPKKRSAFLARESP